MESWVEAGQDPALFWHTTLREISVILAGAARRIEREKMFLQMNAWHTGWLTGRGVNDPKHYPKFETLTQTNRSGKPRSDEEIRERLRMWTQALGGEIPE